MQRPQNAGVRRTLFALVAWAAALAGCDSESSLREVPWGGGARRDGTCPRSGGTVILVLGGETSASGLSRFPSTVVWITAALALLVVVGVVSRKAGFSLVWYDEVAAILLAWLTYYGAALAALHRAHLGLPNLVRRAPRSARLVLSVLREAAIIGFFALAAWMGLDLLAVLGGTFLVSLPWLPAQIVYSAIPVGAVFFIVAELTVVVEDWQRSRTA